MTKKLLTQVEYAKHRGVTPSAVNQAIKQGRISLVKGKVDRAKADADWDANTDHSRRPGSSGEGGDFWAAKTEAEVHRAALLKLDLAEREREVVRVDKLSAAHAAIARATRTALWNLVPRLSPAMAAESDPKKIAASMEKEFTQLCVELQRALDAAMATVEDDAE